jgi:hypothetical protein
VHLEFCRDLLRRIAIYVLLTGGDLTGLPMNRLVSYEEQNAAPLEALNTNV